VQNFCIFKRIWLKLGADTHSLKLEEYYENNFFKLDDFIRLAIF